MPSCRRPSPRASSNSSSRSGSHSPATRPLPKPPPQQPEPLSATKPLPRPTPQQTPSATTKPTATAPTVAKVSPPAAGTTNAPAAAAAALGPIPAAFTKGATVLVNSTPYSVLELLGKGGTSQVFRVLSPDGEVLALKQVKLDGEGPDEDGQLLTAVKNEIELMQSFKAKGLCNYIIKLVDAEVKLEDQLVYMVMECGEIDLAGMLRRHWQEARERNENAVYNENFVCMYWEQMLRAVHAMHEARVIHGDLKPANFLCVRGALKLIDFGIAKTMANPDNTKIARENTVGTVNYMSPEAIYGDDDGQHKQGRASDVWSLGCILYQMVHGATPFSHLKNIIQRCRRSRTRASRSTSLPYLTLI